MSEVEKETKKYSTSFQVQSYFNVLNHIFNGTVACFMTLYLIREGRDSFSWHVFLTTIGYQVFMAEAIMVYYPPNSWTYFLSHKTRKHVHWVLQLIGAIFIITGNVIITVIRTTPHFQTIHSVTGLISMILLVITMLQGVAAFFAWKLRSKLKPNKSKFLHNINSILCFIIGMVSLIFGYRYGSTHDLFETEEVEYSLIAVAMVTMILTLIGAVKSCLKFINKSLN